LLIAVIIAISGCYNCKRVFEGIRKEKWQYHIDTLYVNSDHANLTFIVSSKSEHHVLLGVDELKNLFDHASVGDSIYKEIGSLEFKLIKKDTMMSFYPECDGVSIK
jgi:hypothetical protein